MVRALSFGQIRGRTMVLNLPTLINYLGPKEKDQKKLLVKKNLKIIILGDLKRTFQISLKYEIG